MTPVFTAALLVGLLPGVAVAGQLCVSNGTKTALLFTAENHDGDRLRSKLAPNEQLCIDDGARPGGTIAAFENETRLEGCSRLIGPGGHDRLITYAAFDRCRWQSHGD